MQVRFADVVEGAVDAALQQCEVALNRVGMMEAASFDVLACGVIDAAMAGELRTD